MNDGPVMPEWLKAEHAAESDRQARLAPVIDNYLNGMLTVADLVTKIGELCPEVM